jgi:hypothetical protein
MATNTERSRKHRARLRHKGMKPIQIWVPDPDSPEFAAEARRQSLVVANSPDEQEVVDWLEELSTGIWDDE